MGALDFRNDTIVDTVGLVKKFDRVSIDEVSTKILVESKTDVYTNEVSTNEVLIDVEKIGVLTRIFIIEVHTAVELEIAKDDGVEIARVYNLVDEGGFNMIEEVLATSVIDALSYVEPKGI